jgi:hypothetical protein
MSARWFASLLLSPRLASTACLVLAVVAGARAVDAQAYIDPMGPVRCFALANTSGLAEDNAIALCGGAPSEAPGRCYAEAAARLTELSTLQLQELCTNATSTQPIECYTHVYDAGTVTEDQVIAYCTTTCPIGPAPAQAPSPACFAAAVEQANLPHQTASELCTYSRSAAPVQCLIAGRDLPPGISDSKLVQLCVQSQRCQYYNVAPQGY